MLLRNICPSAVLPDRIRLEYHSRPVQENRAASLREVGFRAQVYCYSDNEPLWGWCAVKAQRCSVAVWCTRYQTVGWRMKEQNKPQDLEGKKKKQPLSNQMHRSSIPHTLITLIFGSLDSQPAPNKNPWIIEILKEANLVSPLCWGLNKWFTP